MDNNLKDSRRRDTNFTQNSDYMGTYSDSGSDYSCSQEVNEEERLPDATENLELGQTSFSVKINPKKGFLKETESSRRRKKETLTQTKATQTKATQTKATQKRATQKRSTLFRGGKLSQLNQSNESKHDSTKKP